MAAALAAAWPRSARAQTSLFASFAEMKPVLDWIRTELPADLAAADPAKWDAWNRQNDRAIRARLDTGDLDSVVNLLLFGTSFTPQPRIRIEEIARQSRAGVLKARTDDLVLGLKAPGTNERLGILRDALARNGIHFNTPEQRHQAGVFILQNLTRVLEEKQRFAARSAAATKAHPDAAPYQSILAERSQIFRDRGISVDTGILPDFSLDLTLRRLKDTGELSGAGVGRLAVIGPGLAIIDKDETSAFDYYPLQTIQPFALLDSLLRLGQAREAELSLTALDISPLVLSHFRRARQQAEKGIGYVIQLPQDIGITWPPELERYWASLGDRIGTGVEPIRPPAGFPGLKTRAVQIRPDVVLRCQAVDLDMVAQRLNLTGSEKFDLVVATNVFLYYDRFQQALALENVASMMKPYGLLLANDDLPLPPSSGVRQIGALAITDGGSGRDAVAMYRKM